MAKKIKWTEYINERAIATSITVNKQRITLVSVYFPHSGYADQHVEKVYKSIEKITRSSKTCKLWEETSTLIGGTWIVAVLEGSLTLNESNRRGDWLKQWLMLQKFVALNTMYKKHLRNKIHTGHLKVQRSSWTTSW